MWEYTGVKRPPFAVEPGAGQESVWDYPRPPRLEPCGRLVQVSAGELEIARTTRSLRVLETASPPTFYLPPGDVDWDHLTSSAGGSICEWKGAAEYFALAVDPAIVVAWCYRKPTARFADLAGYVGFYPGRVACFVNEERVQPQPGGFYGGWITAEIVGPCKGEPGTSGW
jgi:uncharacterized protein (DUF427 family)